MKIENSLRKLIFLGYWVMCLFMSGFIISSDDKGIVRINSMNADEVNTDLEGNLIFTGSVLIETNHLDIKANLAIFNEKKSELTLLEGVSIETSNVDISGKKIFANFAEQLFSASDAKYLFKKGSSGNVEKVSIDAASNLIIENSSYTNCSINDPFWEISSNKVSLLSEDDNAVIEGVRLKIKGVTVIYIPKLRTAIGNKRMSGFLTPSVSKGTKGLDIELPYYFNLSPNYDLVLSPKIIPSRGNGLYSNFRYLSNNSNGKILISGIRNDKEFKKFSNLEEDRWLVHWSHESKFLQHWSSNIDYTSASDSYYFRDIGDDQYGSNKTNILNKKANVRWANENTQLIFGLSRFQSMNPLVREDFKSIPNIKLDYQKHIKGIIYRMKTLFDKYRSDGNNLKDEAHNTERLIFSNSVKYNFSSKLTANFFQLGFDHRKHNQNKVKSSSDTLWLIGESKIFLDKKTRSQFSTISPLIRYIYSEKGTSNNIPLIDSEILPISYSNILSGNIYSGYDKKSYANNIVLGIERFSKNRNGSKTKVVIGQSFYLKDKMTNRLGEETRNSPTIIEFSKSFNSKFTTYSTMEWNHKDNKVDSAYLSISYANTKSLRAELRSILRRNEDLYNINIKEDLKKQMEIIFEAPLINSWKIFTRWQRDLKNKESLDMIYGAEYSNCCLKLGIMKRRWKEIDYFKIYDKNFTYLSSIDQNLSLLESKSSVFITIELKGLGRIGKNFTKAISSPRLN